MRTKCFSVVLSIAIIFTSLAPIMLLGEGVRAQEPTWYVDDDKTSFDCNTKADIFTSIQSDASVGSKVIQIDQDKIEERYKDISPDNYYQDNNSTASELGDPVKRTYEQYFPYLINQPYPSSQYYSYRVVKRWPPTDYSGSWNYSYQDSSLICRMFTNPDPDPDEYKIYRRFGYFNTGTLPKNAEIETVRLEVFAKRSADSPTSEIAVCLCTYDQDTPIDAHGAVWVNTGEIIAAIPAPLHSDYEWYSVDLDPEIINREGNTSIALRLLNEVLSEEGTYVGTKYVKLYVEYCLYEPVASFTYSPLNPKVGDEITFDASSSYDTDGEIVEYQWRFWSDDIGFTEATGQVVTHVFHQAGYCTADLYVVDDDGLGDSFGVLIHVACIPPSAQFDFSPTNPYVEQEVTFNASQSHDGDGHIIGYSWSFGGSGVEATHKFDKPGEYQVTLTVVDDDHCADRITKSIVVKPSPVLLVHGFWSSDNMWKGPGGMEEYLVKEGFYVKSSEYAAPYSCLGMWCFSTNKDITNYAKALSREIKNLKNEKDSEKVDIVAHSMGGLVSRYYTLFDQTSADVGKLIMIGTPNHGSELAWGARGLAFLCFLAGAIGQIPAALLGGYTIKELFGTAGLQMTPGSSFLRSLGEMTKKDIDHTTIAGTQNYWPFIRDFLRGKDDGIVRVDSVKISGLPVQEVYANHFLDALLWKSECKHPDTREMVKNTLLGKGPSQEPLSQTDIETQETPIQEAPIVTGTIYPGEEKSHDIIIGSANETTFSLYWLAGNVTFNLKTPSGRIIDPVVAGNDTSISYHGEIDFIKGYTIQGPEPGIWQAEISAVDVPEEGVDYIVLTALESGLVLSIYLATNQYDPNAEIIITGNLTDNGVPLPGANVTVEIRKPDGNTDILTLYDDGLHDDGVADDGVYANTYTDTSQWGMYNIIVTASGESSGERFERQAFTAIWVEQYPDLTLTSEDIQFSHITSPVGGNVTIEATIHNIGEADAGNATVYFYDGHPSSGTLIGEDVIDIQVVGNDTASTWWIAPDPAIRQIYVAVSPYNNFLEEDYSNNSAHKGIVVGNLSVEWNNHEAPVCMLPGQSYDVKITTTNDGNVNWPAKGDNPVLLSYHWYKDGEPVVYEGIRTELPNDVLPGGNVTLNAAVFSPTERGNYTLQWDMVCEDIAWFSIVGGSILDVSVTVAFEPEVTTNPVTDVTPYSATLNGNLTSLGDASIVFVSFEWGLYPTYGNETDPETMTDIGTFSAPISGLIPGPCTVYHYRAKAVGNCTAYGDDMMFVAEERMCGDVNCSGERDMFDVIDLLYYVGYPGQYTLCDDWAGDVNCTGGEPDMFDVVDLLYFVGYPGQYELSCCW